MQASSLSRRCLLPGLTLLPRPLPPGLGLDTCSCRGLPLIPGQGRDTLLPGPSLLVGLNVRFFFKAPSAFSTR